jgi:GMP synthase (glutamine-hydrolysing)
MRKDETEEVSSMFSDLGIDLNVIDASERFFENLSGVIDPEEKRKKIGEQFIRVFEEEQLGSRAKYLVQGTIAPDWIESGGGERDVIKSHHNVGGLPDDVSLAIVEPLREFYKDEVRQIARHLEIPSSERQPFPGPGLAVRVLGEVTPERADSCREACHIVETRIREAASKGRCDLPWQYFAALLPVRSVGVHGDTRVHGETIVIRAVTSMDGMSARFSPLPQDLLSEISTEITNSLKGQVNRVVYDITHKPPGTIEWE